MSWGRAPEKKHFKFVLNLFIYTFIHFFLSIGRALHTHHSSCSGQRTSSTRSFGGKYLNPLSLWKGQVPALVPAPATSSRRPSHPVTEFFIGLDKPKPPRLRQRNHLLLLDQQIQSHKSTRCFSWFQGPPPQPPISWKSASQRSEQATPPAHYSVRTLSLFSSHLLCQILRGQEVLAHHPHPEVQIPALHSFLPAHGCELKIDLGPVGTRASCWCPCW